MDNNNNNKNIGTFFVFFICKAMKCLKKKNLLT